MPRRVSDLDRIWCSMHGGVIDCAPFFAPPCRFKPLVQLDEVETSTGEEAEDCLFEWWVLK